MALSTVFVTYNFKLRTITIKFVRFLLGNTPASGDARVLPKRKHTTYKTGRKFEIKYAEIKCQLDAKDDIFLQILLLAQHVSGTLMPIIRSPRVLYRWSLPVVFGALVFKLSVWFGAEGYMSGLRAAAVAARKPDT